METNNNDMTRKEIDIETPQKKNEDITTGEKQEDNKQGNEGGSQDNQLKRGDKEKHKERENPDNPVFEDTEWVKK
ncbi:MAG TPA: hypothetical protein VGK25_01385, partial [Ignavibacteria bacterium]